MPSKRSPRRPSEFDYQRLLGFRSDLRRFLHWSEEQAREAGITSAQHQLMLAIRGHPDPRGPSIGELADYLVLRHHSAVGLVDRAVSAGLVRRVRDTEHPGTVRVLLTPSGADRLEALSGTHLEELDRLSSTMEGLRRTLGGSSA
jgi:DNA-binding MarR family transcriptional regulator